MQSWKQLLVPALALALLGATGSSTITVRDAWVRATPPGAPTAAAYGMIENQSDTADRLVAVETDAAEAAELHTMTMKDGMMVMRPVAGGLEVPGKGSVQLKPGGYHIMLIHPKGQIKPGDKVQVTLVFEHAGKVTLPIMAMEQAPGGMKGTGGMGHGSMQGGSPGSMKR